MPCRRRRTNQGIRRLPDPSAEKGFRQMRKACDEVLAYLAGKSPIKVLRISEEEIKVLGTTPNNCHHNVYRYVARNKDLGVEHVYGWTILNDHYLLHSVVRHQDGRVECITPSIEDCGPRLYINFIEDPQIGLRDFKQNGEISAEVVRNGRFVPDKIRIPRK